jgi:hypothetical protein
MEFSLVFSDSNGSDGDGSSSSSCISSSGSSVEVCRYLNCQRYLHIVLSNPRAKLKDKGFSAL